MVWIVRVTALIALFAGLHLVIPGVDAMAIEALKHSGGPSSTLGESVSLFSVALLPLLVVSIALVMFGSPDPTAQARRERIGAVVFLLWCAVSAFTQARWLASVGRTSYDAEYLPVLVDDIGLRFQAVAVLTWVGGGAVLWFLAQWVTRRGEILGAILFAGASAITQDVERFQAGWRLAQMGEIAVAPLAHTLPWTLGLLALWRAKPSAWPVQAPFRFQLRSRWEALLFPLAIAASAGSSDFLRVPLTIAAAILVWISLSKTSQSRGSALFLVAALLFPLPAIGLFVWPIVEGAREARTPGPFAGSGNFDVELTCANATAELTAADVKVFERRLARARVQSTVRSDAPGRLRLTLNQVGSPQDLIGALTPRYRLRFQLVARDQSLLAPSTFDWQAAGLSVERDYDGEAITGPTPESLATWLNTVEVPEGFELSIECRERETRTRCSAKMLEASTALDGSTIREARVSRDFMNQPNVTVDFNSEGAAQLSNISSEIGRQLAIVLDGKILSAPTIRSRIDGGTASITLGRQTGTPEQQFANAQRIADGLSSSPLGCVWQATSLNVKP
ncbi:MAG: hypothetical protein JNM17_06125 [Archangium sp.]|nr:hypothetical protein [Archangium sp.]